MTRIVHFHENTLPDTRLEKYATSLKKIGDFEIHYVGGPKVKKLDSNLQIDEVYDGIHILPTNRLIRLGLPFIFRNYVKRFQAILEDIESDIVHAHNIFAAKACVDLGIDFIYDDHEFWTFQGMARMVRPKSFISKNRLTDWWVNRKFKKWEPEVVRNASAVIGLNKNHIDDLIELYGNEENKPFLIVPNFPSKQEIDNFPLQGYAKRFDEIKTILVTKSGGVLFDESTIRYFNSLMDEGLPLTLLGHNDHIEIPKIINNKGFVDHQEFLSQLAKHHVGLVQFARNKFPEFYRYLSLNKVYYYAHYGVIPVLKREMTYLREVFGDLAIVIDSEKDIGPKLSGLNADMTTVEDWSNRLIKFAQENLVFDHHMDQVSDLYTKLST